MNTKRIVAALVLGLIACNAAAVPVTFEFTGTVTSATGIWMGQGAAVTGSYTYDTGLMDSSPADNTVDIFNNNSPGANQTLTSVFDITVSLGATTRSTTNNQNNPGSAAYSVTWTDASNLDQFEILSGLVVPTDEFARILLLDFTPSPPDAVAVGSGNLTGSPSAAAPNLPLFDSGIGAYSARDKQTAQKIGDVFFTVDSIITADVSEPITLLLMGLGLAGFPLVKKRR